MAEKLDVVSEESNQVILTYISQIEDSKDSDECKRFMDSVHAYLIKLDAFMAARETCDILKQLPSVGKLISTISKTFSRTDRNPDVILDCIVHLSKIPSSLNSSSNMERKVGQWAADHLHAFSVSSMKQLDAEFMDCLGISQDEFNNAQITEMSSMILYGNLMTEAHSDVCSLCKILQSLLPLLDEQRVKNLIQSVLIATEKVLKVFNNQVLHHSSLNDFLDAVTKNRKLIKNLSNESRISLWKCHLSAFEFEILDMVKVVVKNPFIGDQSIAKLLNERFQIVLDFCTEDDVSYEHANDILRASVLEWGCLPSLTSLVHQFSLVIRGKQRKKTQNRCEFSEKFFRRLPLSLNGLHIKEQEGIIKMMVEEIEEMKKSSRLTNFDMRFLLMQNKNYIDSALHLSLHGSVDALDSVIELLFVYYNPTSTENSTTTTSQNHSKIKKIFRSFMMNMRCLLHKNILQPTDLSYPIELCRKGASGESSLVSHLMRDLALLFLIRADASHYILREIFSIITVDFPNRIKLDLWLRVLENNIYLATSFSADKRHVSSVLAHYLLDRSKSELLDLNAKIPSVDNEEQSLALTERVMQLAGLFQI